MDEDAVKNEKRTVYLMVVPTTIVPLKSKGFKVESPPMRRSMTSRPRHSRRRDPTARNSRSLSTRRAGLPVRLIAKVAGWMGEEYVQEVHYSDYKEFGGIKKSTKVTVKRDGEPFVSQEITEFKVLDKVPAETFAEPK